jgi:hypothetical protein
MADNVGGLRSVFCISCRLARLYSQSNEEFAAHDGYIFGDEHEKYYVRLKVGFISSGVKSSFISSGCHVAALVAPSAFAVQYLSVDQAQQAISPGKNPGRTSEADFHAKESDRNRRAASAS